MEKKPKTIHSASRIPGIRPPTLLYLYFIASKGKSQNMNKKMA